MVPGSAAEDVGCGDLAGARRDCGGLARRTDRLAARAAAAAVALALQVGVNFANDYSDGVRGTDAQRRGPVRLTATGLATPRCGPERGDLAFAVAAVVGAVLSLVVNPWLLLVGVAAIGPRSPIPAARSPTATSAWAR